MISGALLSNSLIPESKHGDICRSVCGVCGDLCGFPDCALDVVYTFRLLREAWSSSLSFFSEMEGEKGM